MTCKHCGKRIFLVEYCEMHVHADSKEAALGGSARWMCGDGYGTRYAEPKGGV